MTLTPEMVEIAPCPFCGTNDQFVERLDYSACYVQCDGAVGDGCSCLCRGPIGVQDSDDEEMPGQAAAIRAWNARAQSKHAVGVEELMALVTELESLDDDSTEWQIAWNDACRTAAHKMRALIERAGGGV